jgi:hypothetical protein
LKKGTKRSASVSQIIRDYAEKNPGLGPTQIAKDLLAQGHKAYPALVSQALGKTGKKKKAKATAKRGRKPKAVKSAPGVEVNLSSLKAACEFIKSSGSAENAIASIRNYQKLSSMFQ